MNNSYKPFFTREKKFLDAISRDYSFNRFIFEHRDIETYKEGKFKKDVLVVPVDKLKISYSHFPRLKEPNSGTFNFEQSKDAE